jgi:universal stress protein E
MANSIDADLVILGNVGRQGLSGLTVGNTAEKILTDIKADVLVLVQEVAESIKAA